MSREEDIAKAELLTERVNKVDLGAKETDPPVIKWSVKMTVKAFLAKVETLQKERKDKLKKAASLKETIVNLMGDKSFVKEVKNAFDKYTKLCDEAVAYHESLLKLMPTDECERHEMWFKVKMFPDNEFVSEVNKLLGCNESCCQNEGTEDDKLKPQTHEVIERPQTKEVQVEPHDSISNVISNTPSKHSRSSISSLQRQMEAEQAVIMARAAALKKKHALEEQAEQLRRKQEQLEIETHLAASAAKLTALNDSACSSVASKHRECSDGMSSYLSSFLKSNPHATLFIPAPKMEPVARTQAQQTSATQAHQSNINPSVQVTPSQGNGDLYSLLHKQNKVTALLPQTQSFQFLPRREVPSFNGQSIKV